MRLATLLTLAAACVAMFSTTTVEGARRLDGSNSICGGERIRKSWYHLTQPEKDLYMDAVKSAIKSKQFYEFARIHLEVSSESQAHDTCAFLIWHKRFLLAYENMLRSQGPKYACVTVPFWDVNQEYADLIDGKCSSIGSCSQIVKDMGGMSSAKQTVTFNGVTRGVNAKEVCYSGFAGKTYCGDNKVCGCIPRNDLTKAVYPSSVGYSTLFTQIGFCPSFSEFTKTIQTGAHNEFHGKIGGLMGTMASPMDPLFFSWHANIDFYLYLYNQCHVPSAMKNEELQDSLFGFNQGEANCQYDPNAPKGDKGSKIVQQSKPGQDASKNPLVGKYFADLAPEMEQWIGFTNQGEYGYRYHIPKAYLEELLQKPELCLTYYKEWSEGTQVTEAPYVPGSVNPGQTDEPGQTDQEDDSEEVETTTPKPPKNKKSGKYNKSTSGSGSGPDVGDQGEDIPSPNQDGDVKQTNGTSLYIGTDNIVDQFSKDGSQYWKWYGGCRKEISTAYPGNVTEIAKQIETASCLCFSEQFEAIEDFDEEFMKAFKLDDKEPPCKKTVEKVEKGEEKICVETKGFEQEPEIKKDWPIAPAVDPEQAYEDFIQEAKQAAGLSAGASLTAFTSASAAIVAFVAFML
jgi:hypothetical protein